ncbi:response regulator transcription factor [Embleya sp. NPDC050493]|uniref:response regulator transcription factor n=1 Tax=Embleya sp. NPDC050493 TaxID=3363989 RepID=UPI0037B3701D
MHPSSTRSTIGPQSVAEFKVQTMDFLAESVSSTGMVFYSVDPELNAVGHVFRAISPVRNTTYLSFFHRLDPFHPRQFAALDTPLATLYDLGERFDASEYYRRFMRPLGIRFEAELYLRHGGELVGGVSLLRDAREGDFTPGELRFLRKAHPYLEYAFGAWQRPTVDAAPVSEWELTEREFEVVALVREGVTNAEIGRALSISVPTVKSHLQHVFDKTGLRSRTQLLAHMLRDRPGTADHRER